MSEFKPETIALDYWQANPNAMYMTNTWTNNPYIADYVYRRISNGASNMHWLSWVLSEHLGRKFVHAICPGCGSGGHEISMRKSGFVEKVDAFDFSTTSIDLARQSAINQNIDGINFYVDNLNSFVLNKNIYDLACFTGSLHHVSNLEHCLAQVRDSLKIDGIIVIWEYVGPCYLLWTNKQVEQINKILDILPPEFKITNDAFLKKHTLDQQLQADPSEATRSSLIPQLLPEYFDIIYEKDVGGSVLHPIYPLLNNARLIEGDVAAKTILDLLIRFEESSIESGSLTSDFKFYIGRSKA